MRFLMSANIRLPYFLPLPALIPGHLNLRQHGMTFKSIYYGIKGIAATALCLPIILTYHGQLIRNADKPLIVAYLSRLNIDTSSIPFRYVDVINYAFLLPDSVRLLKPVTSGQQDSLQALIQAAHHHRVKVFASIGGWNIGSGGGNPSTFRYLSSSSKKMNAFTHCLVKTCQLLNLDGIDLDWEYPRPDDSSGIQFIQLLKNLADSLHDHHLRFSVAVAPLGYYARVIPEKMYAKLDWINIMAYDATDMSGHPMQNQASYSYASQALDYWIKDRHFPASKIELGIPFYGKTPDGQLLPYRSLLSAGANPRSDYYRGYSYNGTETVLQKSLLAKHTGTGIMIWELSQDSSGKNSLLRTIFRHLN